MKINWLGFAIMLMGIFLGVISPIIQADLDFIAGMLFGTGLMNLKDEEKEKRC